MRSRQAEIIAILALLGLGCSQVTEVVVVVDSDLAVPSELDSVRIDVTSPGGEFRRASAPLVGERAIALPRTLGIVYRGGPLEPLVVVATGSLNGRDVVQRRARLAFAPGRTVELRLDLLRSCVDVACAIDQTCTAQGCASSEVDVARLRDWTGASSGMDASVPRDGGDGGADADAIASDACVVAPEQCNDRDDDCDGQVDEDFDLTADPTHCGSCAHSCSPGPNASPRCAASVCALTCDSGWADCDSSLLTGCEALLSLPLTCGSCSTQCSGPTPFCSVVAARGLVCTATCALPMTACSGSCVELATSSAHCGRCDAACPPVPGATPVCSAGACSFTCSPGLYDCNGPADGCESTLRTLTSCGACGVVCGLPHATTSCTSGTCALIGCDAGWGDCNGIATDGCEAALDVDPMHCGSCGVACPVSAPNAASSCAAGTCVLVCDRGWADCNRMASDGCEAALSSGATCGSCGIRCDGATPLCATDASGGHLCASGCGPGEALCSGTCANTSIDPNHCGSCATTCPPLPNASPVCAASACGFACHAGWADCDAIAATGCEASLSSLTSCGACGSVCAPIHATATCATGTCAIASCDTGWGNCDASAANGCETSLTAITSCGACGNICPTGVAHATGSACTSGACVLACAAGWADCDGVPSNGCETSLSTASSCGACGVACTRANATPTCSTGSCRIASCDASWGNCDGLDANGCERSLATITDCGSCGTACDAAASCTASTCVCPAPLLPSGADCIDTARDPRNCGAVGARCPNDDQYCVAGACVCRPGLTLVAGGCVDLATDPANCGIAGRVCTGATPRCAGGACVASCPSGTTACADACVRLDTSPSNCGGCGATCALDEVCVASRCEVFRSAAGCTACPCAGRCGGLGYSSCCSYPMTSDLVCVDALGCP